MKTAIEIENLSHSFGNRAVLRNISFSVTRGDFFVIIGPNGSGKTTLMRAIAGILSRQTGQIKIFERRMSSYKRKEFARLVAFVPQGSPTGLQFTAAELVLMGRAPYTSTLGIETEKDYQISKQAMHFTEVAHLAARKLDQLSGGEQQRVFIARAICQEPKILLLDEPTASLDLAHQVRIMDLMEKLKEDKGVTVVMVSHDINLAAMYGGRLLLLRDGQIVCMGPPKEILNFKTLEDTYGCRLLVDESPLGKLPRVTVVPQKFLKA
ncbi:MAG: ABC transporter ATP-binding protein [Desulfobacterales bacterium]|nr:ABC transporter ATP-binding protein [Desulfobacterales bacterium]